MDRVTDRTSSDKNLPNRQNIFYIVEVLFRNEFESSMVVTMAWKVNYYWNDFSFNLIVKIINVDK